MGEFEKGSIVELITNPSLKIEGSREGLRRYYREILIPPYFGYLGERGLGGVILLHSNQITLPAFLSLNSA
ncbi:MAG TPA: hypothetical protein VF941_22855 [Clostridia bacterium]